MPRSDDMNPTTGTRLDSIASLRGYTISDYSQPFYNSTQSVIQLTLLLRDGLRPSEVLMVSGPGDVLAAIESGDPTVPLGSGVYRAMTWPGSEGAIALEELRRRAIQRDAGSPAMVTIIRNLGSDEDIYYRPFTGTRDLSDEEIDSLSTAILEMILVYCETMEVLGSSFSFDGRIVWLEAYPDDEIESDPYYSLHHRTDLLVTEIADSLDCLTTFKYNANALPGSVGSGYSGLDAAQSAELADYLMSMISISDE